MEYIIFLGLVGGWKIVLAKIVNKYITSEDVLQSKGAKSLHLLDWFL